LLLKSIGSIDWPWKSIANIASLTFFGKGFVYEMTRFVQLLTDCIKLMAAKQSYCVCSYVLLKCADYSNWWKHYSIDADGGKREPLVCLVLDLRWESLQLCMCVRLAGIPSTLLSYKFGYRVSIMLGGVLASTGFALSFFCRELHELYLCIGAVAGNCLVLLSLYSCSHSGYSGCTTSEVVTIGQNKLLLESAVFDCLIFLSVFLCSLWWNF